MPKMKPCPFCGDADPMTMEGDGKFYAFCANRQCFCALGESYDRSAMPEHHFETRDAAVAAWNSRK